MLEGANQPKGLLRAVLFLYRAPAPRAAQAGLLAASNSVMSVITAQAARLSRQGRLQVLPAEYVGAVNAVILALGDCLPDPTDLDAPSLLPPQAAVSALDMHEAAAFFFRAGA